MGVKPNRKSWLARNAKPVQPVKVENSVPVEPEVKPTVAADLLKSNHPLYNMFQSWCVDRSVEPTRRQAVKFLQANPSYRAPTTA